MTGMNGGGTPLYAALGGAEQWAGAYQMAHPTEKTVVILMTDGEPRGCDEDVTHIAGLAATSLQMNKVPTYAIGLVGSQQAQMDQIAQAGGTMMGYFIGSGTNAQKDLLAALTSIRGKTISCDFPMPRSSVVGQEVDPTLVNVNFTPSTGGASQTLNQVANMGDCSSTGWYYDNRATPSRITLCPTTCSMVQADQKGKLDILLGCQTVVSVN
jgi:hypothetical protein